MICVRVWRLEICSVPSFQKLLSLATHAVLEFCSPQAKAAFLSSAACALQKMSISLRKQRDEMTLNVEEQAFQHETQHVVWESEKG